MNRQITLQMQPNLNTGMGITPAIRSGRYLEVVAIKSDGIVVSDSALVEEAEDGVRVKANRPGAIGNIILLGCMLKVSVMHCQVIVKQQISLLAGSNVVGVEELNQTICRV